MSDGNRGAGTSPLEALLVVVLLGIVACVIYATGRSFGVEAGRDEVTAREHYENAKENSLLACRGADGVAVADCVIEAIEAAQAQSDSRQDLYAQKDMAKFAFWMMIATIFTAATTAIGVFYVKRTLDQSAATNRAAVGASVAANEANAIMRAEQRPWVTLERDILCDAQDHGSALRLCWNWNLRNKGKTPAHDVKMRWKAIKGVDLLDLKDFAADYVEKARSWKWSPTATIIFPGEATDMQRYHGGGFNQYRPGNKVPVDGEAFVLMCIKYRLGHGSDVFGYECRVFGFEPSDQFIGPFATKMLEYSYARHIE